MMDFDLKEVFSILDENNEGQIQLRRFVDVANNYYSDAEVSLTFGRCHRCERVSPIVPVGHFSNLLVSQKHWILVIRV